MTTRIQASEARAKFDFFFENVEGKAQSEVLQTAVPFLSISLSQMRTPGSQRGILLALMLTVSKEAK